MILLATIIAALGFRLRGGLWNDKIKLGSTTMRLLAWALPMTVITAVAAYPLLPLWMVPVVFLSWWAGTLLGWWKSIDMGRVEGTFEQDFIMQTIRGLFWTLPVFAVLTLFNVIALGTFPLSLLFLVLAGLSCGLCYEAGWRLANKKPIMGGTEYGELLFGALIGFATVLAVY